MRHWILVATCVVFGGCALPGTRQACPPPRVRVVSSGVAGAPPYSWVEGAWGAVYNRLSLYPVCEAVEGLEVWVRYHRADPLLCAGRPPYYTCTVVGHTPSVHYVEINLVAPGTPSVYELLLHEFLHVGLSRLGAPGPRHHQIMDTSGWVIRRNAFKVDIQPLTK